MQSPTPLRQDLAVFRVTVRRDPRRPCLKDSSRFIRPSLTSTCKPGTRINSRSLLVTRIHPSAQTWAASHRSEGFPLLRRGIVAAIGHEVGGQAHQRIEDPGGINRRCAQNDFIAAPENFHRFDLQTEFLGETNEAAAATGTTASNE